MPSSEYVKSQKASIHRIVVFAIIIIIQSFASILFPQIVQQVNERLHDLYTLSFSFFACSILGVCARMNENCNEFQDGIHQK